MRAAPATAGIRRAAWRPAPPKSKRVDDGSPCAVIHECGGYIAVDPIRGTGVTLGDPGKYPSPRAFRHKVATPFAPGKDGAVRCGFFARRTHRIIAVPACAVEAPEAPGATRSSTDSPATPGS